jgi:hypothetical protein
MRQTRPYYATKWDLSPVSPEQPEQPEWCFTPWEVAMKSRLTRLTYTLAALACLAAALGAGYKWH